MNNPTRARRHKRIMLWSLLIIAVGAMVLPLSGYLYVSIVPAQAATEQGVNPHANFWRAVREGDRGDTVASGPYTTNRLINNGGQNYREIRNGPISSIGPWVLAGVAGLILLYFVIHGKTRVEAPASGRMVERWGGGERLVHWYVAILFIILAITGLSLLFGRAVLIPVLGLPGFAAYAQFAKDVHNYAGPLFIVGVVLMVIAWIRYNTFKSYDWEWMRRFGGMFKRGVHPPAGRANAGEKLWFWFVAIVGLLGVCISGLVLDFPIFGQSRDVMEIAAIVHAILALLWIAVSLGHIYLGSIGIEGAFKGMAGGQVSEEWMKQHHNMWWEHLQSGGEQREESRREGGETRPGQAT